MSYDPIGAIVDGVNPVGFAVDYASDEIANNRQVNSTMELQDHQAMLDQKNWLERHQLEQEDYSYWNTPKNQVERLREAGFNPYVYGNGSASTVGSSTASVPNPGSASPSAVAPAVQGSAGSELSDALQHQRLTPHEMRLKDAQSTKETTQANVNEADAELRSIQSKVEQFKLDKTLPQDVKESIARVENLVANSALADADTKLRSLQTASEILKQSYTRAQTDEVRERIRLLDKEIKNYDANAHAQRTAQYASAYESETNAELNTSKRLSTDLEREIRSAVKESEIYREMSENERQALDNLLNQQLIQDYLTLRSNKAGRITDDVLQYLKNLVGGIVSGNVVIPVMPKQKKMGKIGF